MKIAISGTPGTGKTSVTKLLEKKHPIIHLNEYVKENELTRGYDKERKSYHVDLEAVDEELPKEAIIESHFSHLLEVDRIIVLRCHPNELEKRLSGRDEDEIKENLEAEAIDKILIESLDRLNDVHEIDTTNRSKKEVAKLIDRIIKGNIKKEPGQIDWSNWLLEE